MDLTPLELDDAPAPKIRLRGRQQEWLDKAYADWNKFNRLLFVAPGGIGKGTLAAAIALREWEVYGKRTLITENRERLTEQMAERVRDETGLEVDVEMGDQRASPYAQVVVGNIQSIGRRDRLTGFAPDHFGCYIPDECHLMLAPQPIRVADYFTFGRQSLEEGWVRPKVGELYKPLSKSIGFTASPDIGERRHLGEWFEHVTTNYSYLSALEEGWLVGIVEKNLPVKIDTRKFRRRQTAEGADFNLDDQAQAIMPVIKELAEQIVVHAKDRKTICFMPSVDTSRMMADALNGMGMNAIFASGECLDKNEKTIAYNKAPRGTVFVNCALVVYGIDFPDTDCVAVFRAVLSKAAYVQMVYRGSRVLPGVLREGMALEDRLNAIRCSAKPHFLVLSPFFISDYIDLCSPFDLFATVPDGVKKPKKLPDLTKPAEIRDYIKALEKAADKHAHKQPRTIDPVKFALSVGDGALAHYQPMTSAEAAPPTREELDLLLGYDIDTTQIKSSGEAQRHIARLRERERLGLATPTQLNFLLKLTKTDPTDPAKRVPLYGKEWLMGIKKNVAGALVGKNAERWR